jgi:hypothetical protein
MSKYALALFLLIFGITGLIVTKIPEWITPLAALLAAVTLIIEGVRKQG